MKPYPSAILSLPRVRTPSLRTLMAALCLALLSLSSSPAQSGIFDGGFACKRTITNTTDVTQYLECKGCSTPWKAVLGPGKSMTIHYTAGWEGARLDIKSKNSGVYVYKGLKNWGHYGPEARYGLAMIRWYSSGESVIDSACNPLQVTCTRLSCNRPAKGDISIPRGDSASCKYYGNKDQSCTCIKEWMCKQFEPYQNLCKAENACKPAFWPTGTRMGSFLLDKLKLQPDCVKFASGFAGAPRGTGPRSQTFTKCGHEQGWASYINLGTAQNHIAYHYRTSSILCGTGVQAVEFIDGNSAGVRQTIQCRDNDGWVDLPGSINDKATGVRLIRAAGVKPPPAVKAPDCVRFASGSAGQRVEFASFEKCGNAQNWAPYINLGTVRNPNIYHYKTSSFYCGAGVKAVEFIDGNRAGVRQTLACRKNSWVNLPSTIDNKATGVRLSNLARPPPTRTTGVRLVPHTPPRIPPQVAQCQRMSDLYAIAANKSLGFASAQIRQQWSALRCNIYNTSPAPTLWPKLCQQLSNRFGIVKSVSWGRADAHAKSAWRAMNCITRPHVPQPPPQTPQQIALCQRYSDQYAIFDKKGWGLAPAQIRQQWVAMKCKSVPRTALWPQLCEKLSTTYGISYQRSWGKADYSVKSTYQAMNCKTRPITLTVWRPLTPVVRPPVVRRPWHNPVISNRQKRPPRPARPPVVMQPNLPPHGGPGVDRPPARPAGVKSVGGGCAMLSKTRSTQGGQSVSMVFVNKTITRLKIQWITMSGGRKHYKTIAPNERYSVRTNSHHPWLVSDLEGRCRAVVVPKAHVPQVVIR